MFDKRVIGILLLAGLVAVGCSDKKKEAARLEQEMLEMEQRRADSVAQQAAMEDSAEAVSEEDANAVPEESAPGRIMPRRPQGSGFTVQVASCEDADYAQYLVGLYSDRGYEPYVETYSEGETLYYRVRIGPLATKAEADELKDELKDKYSIDPWITRL